jgi:hypothetical protein
VVVTIIKNEWVKSGKSKMRYTIADVGVVNVSYLVLNHGSRVRARSHAI